MLAICLYVAAGLETLNGLVLITKVGHTKEVYTGGNVAATVALSAFIAVVAVVAALHIPA